MTDMRYSRNSAPMAIITIFARPVFSLAGTGVRCGWPQWEQFAASLELSRPQSEHLISATIHLL